MKTRDLVMVIRISRMLLAAISYAFRFYLEKAQRLIPHPRLRALFFKMLGAEIGKSVRIEDLVVENQACWGFNKLKIGDDTVVTQCARLDLTGSINIGQKCTIAGRIWTHQDPGSFLFDSPIVRRYPRKVGSVVIGNSVWVAADSTILAGINIGDNVVVAAGSVVTQDIPPDTMVAGVPARIIKKLQ